MLKHLLLYLKTTLAKVPMRIRVTRGRAWSTIWFRILAKNRDKVKEITSAKSMSEGVQKSLKKNFLVFTTAGKNMQLMLQGTCTWETNTMRWPRQREIARPEKLFELVVSRITQILLASCLHSLKCSRSSYKKSFMTIPVPKL